jgi:hypothetical protein
MEVIDAVYGKAGLPLRGKLIHPENISVVNTHFRRREPLDHLRKDRRVERQHADRGRVDAGGDVFGDARFAFVERAEDGDGVDRGGRSCLCG